MDRRMQTARTGLLRIICGLLVIAVGSAARAEFVWQNVSGGIPGPLGYNQERRIVRDADNGYLHVTFDNQGAVWYSWSEDNGETWLPDVPPPDNNREEIEGLGMTHGYGAIGVDRANTPWVSWVYGGQVGAEQNKLEGGIRTGGTWVKGESLSPFFPPAEYAGMDQGAIAVTKCPVPTDVAVAYSVVPAEKWNFMGPTGHKYLFLVAWGLDGGVVRSFPTATTTLDYQFLPNAPHVLRASIAVQKDGQSDVIHVVWQRREDNTTRIYHVQSAPITPQQVRAGQPLVWSVRFPVSQSQQQPVTEQATFPSLTSRIVTRTARWTTPSSS